MLINIVMEGGLLCSARVDSKTGPLFGEVQYCIPDGSRFSVGLDVHDGSPAAVGKLTTATHAVT